MNVLNRLIPSIFLLLIGIAACQPNPYVHGEILYQNFCASCHMEDGSGLKGNIPPLAGADYLTKHADRLPCIIRNGIQEPIVVNGITYHQPMAGVPQLTDAEITNIINYMNHSWGNDNGFTNPKVVQKVLKECE